VLQIGSVKAVNILDITTLLFSTLVAQ